MESEDNQTFDEFGLSECEYKEQYKELKRKLRLLIYENEIFQQNLKITQRKLLKASQDKSALLDKLVEYEGIELSSTEDELTELSDSSESVKPELLKRKKTNGNNFLGTITHSISSQTTISNPAKKQKSTSSKVLKSMSTPFQLDKPQSDMVLSMAEVSKTLDDSQSGDNSISQHNLQAHMLNDDFSVKKELKSIYDVNTSSYADDDTMIDVVGLGI